MKLSNKLVYAVFEESNGYSVYKKLTNANLSAYSAFKRMSNTNKLLPIYENIVNARNNLIAQYGKENDNGILEISKNDTENINKFLSEFNSILELEEDVNLHLFELNELGEDLCLSSDDFERLLFMMNIPQEA